MKGMYYENGKLTYRTDLPLPEPAEGEALIKVTKAGICRTDLEIAAGYMNFTGIPGHEFVGVVERADGTPDMVGDRVVGEINCGCGVCSYCHNGVPNHCPKRTVLGIQGRNGAFAEYLTLPIKNLHNLPDFIEDDSAVFAEPIAAAFRIIEQVVVRGKSVMVLGDGKLGILICHCLLVLKAQVTLCGKHSSKLAKLDGTEVVTLLLEELPEKKQFDIVIDATGKADGIALALKHVKPRGHLVLKTTVAQPATIDLNRLVIDEITLVGSRCGPFETALTLLETGSMNPTDLIDETFPLERGLEAFEAAAKPGAMKIVIG